MNATQDDAHLINLLEQNMVEVIALNDPQVPRKATRTAQQPVKIMMYAADMKRLFRSKTSMKDLSTTVQIPTAKIAILPS